MGTGYTKGLSQFVDGETIEASDFTTEFGLVDAAFETGGHQHDGTDGEGGAIEKLLSNSITFGTGADTDIAVTFDGNSSDGVLTWKEDEDYFEFSDDILMASTEKIQFGDTASFIQQSSNGVLRIDGEVTIDLNASTAVTVSHDLKLDSDGAILGFGADNDITLTHTADTGLTCNGTITATGFTIGSAAITETELEILDGASVTTAELNIIDGNTSATSTTVADADRVVLNDNGTMVQVAVTDLAAYFDDEITAMPNLVSTGALDSGSITSGFGTINTGSSAITTTGLISGGSLDIDDVLINGTTIGHTDDTDLITVANGLVTVAGEISVTTLDIGGANVTSTAAELNIVDGNTSATSTTVADADRVVLNDNGTMVQVAVTDLAAYFDDEITAMPNLVSTGALDTGSITSGFGAIDNGTSGIRTNTFTAETSFVPDAADGATLGSASLEFSDLFLADGGQILFGNDQEITLTHVADSGLTLKHAATADDKFPTLTLAAGDTDIAASDKLGVINFQAPDEGTGTDAILVAAGIEAVSEGDFSASSNATSLVFKTASSEAAAEVMRIDSSGAVGIGTTPSGGTALDVRNDGVIQIVSTDTVQLIASNGGSQLKNVSNNPLLFGTNNTERMRITAGGDVGIGTTSPDVPLHVKGGSSVESAIIVDSTGVGGGHKYGIRPGSPSVSNAHFTIHDETNDATRLVITDGGLVLINTTGAVSGQQLRVSGGSGTGTIGIAAAANFNSTIEFSDPDDQDVGKIEYAHNGDQMRFYVNGSQRGLIDSAGRLLMLKTASGLANNGFETHASAAGFLGTTSTSAALYVNREDSDGTLVAFRQDNSNEGSIIVSGSTVTYNGGHLGRWSQAEDGNRIDGLLKGTVMTNLDKMAVWTKEDGTTKNNEQLNCMAVSSVEGDVNVAGVFINWNEEELYDDDYSSSRINDMNVAMTGDMVIRIASGTTIARGDLLMSAGDGTAKPQGDDIVRSKTIAKVISITKSHTYSDGSYLVPCVLMAC